MSTQQITRTLVREVKLRIVNPRVERLVGSCYTKGGGAAEYNSYEADKRVTTKSVNS